MQESTSNRTLLRAVIMLAVGLLVSITLTTVALLRFSGQSGQTQALAGRLAVTQAELVSTQAQLVKASHTFAVSQKASTKTRVSTVSQRCDLTGLILRVLVRVHDQVDAAPFERSEAKCLRQLATVKQINRTTPSP